ncbi:hypothetical protein NLL38_04220 [Corynebacterium accolens]|nr:hypothetical protein [Corynebacterium accolens]WKS72129.1 hypothetical protein NLL38_04220 [Corynebacterium accolens]WKS74453.1 hypothetical protein NLL44_04550 [Corynebacterium accolens]
MARPFPFDDTNEPDEDDEIENKFDSQERWYEQLHDIRKDETLWDN